jgi:hypothetical protein
VKGKKYMADGPSGTSALALFRRLVEAAGPDGAVFGHACNRALARVLVGCGKLTPQIAPLVGHNRVEKTGDAKQVAEAGPSRRREPFWRPIRTLAMSAPRHWRPSWTSTEGRRDGRRVNDCYLETRTAGNWSRVLASDGDQLACEEVNCERLTHHWFATLMRNRSRTGWGIATAGSSSGRSTRTFALIARRSWPRRI